MLDKLFSYEQNSSFSSILALSGRFCKCMELPLLLDKLVVMEYKLSLPEIERVHV